MSHIRPSPDNTDEIIKNNRVGEKSPTRLFFIIFSIFSNEFFLELFLVGNVNIFVDIDTPGHCIE
ncbi:MAG: hypothetical protein K2M63_00390, partial [Muribaculaceae bacterium]|nr:hypothetical protein [Muribaculaceae bacterium]